ncbi:DUF3302 domain-containing protein [Hydrogenovibrio marinus]|uniref:GTPase n=1 Tax=Hydrogenovibrio marinus TaxID=28885 RepID=A0A066ZYB1_HYDMR|nr:DUF3302 domain-containing protein [Hydrogenovibrio marinus]KDN95095.1 hypothetical protein EI16_01940 [Hydrogenovibrio marinus]BBN59567.1 membrane protein [Hydrogenovibrio marinus]
MLDYFALFMLFFVGITLFYGIIAIHDIPYEIAKRRNHPQQDAIHVAGWVSLFTLHLLWPFLWIWATLYREDRGWGFSQNDSSQGAKTEHLINLEKQVGELQTELNILKEQLHHERQVSQGGDQ